VGSSCVSYLDASGGELVGDGWGEEWRDIFLRIERQLCGTGIRDAVAKLSPYTFLSVSGADP